MINDFSGGVECTVTARLEIRRFDFFWLATNTPNETNKPSVILVIHPKIKP